MINRRLTSSEAAARLGVKQETLYAYVSRGLLHPERTGRGSVYDPQEVALLARSGRKPRRAAASPTSGRATAGGPDSDHTKLWAAEPKAADPVFVTELTLIEAGRLYYRGLDAVELSRSRTFEETASWLWTGDWDEAEGDWLVPEVAARPLRQTLDALPAGAAPLERFMAAVVTASHWDDLRHDLNPAGVPVTGRSVLAVLAASLPGVTPPSAGPAGGELISARVWRTLTGRQGEERQLAAVEAALVLSADHELAPSTLAARVAASFRADPYAVVLTGLGPASGGSWRSGSTGAPTEVEYLLEEVGEVGAERAIGERLRRTGEIPHGFGMPLYPEGDPRARELLSRLEGVGDERRLDAVRSLVQVAEERGFPPPNFDLSLGALSYCSRMSPGAGQAIFTLGKVAGWLAHAIEEYSAPTRFRSRADYIGPRP